MNEASYRAYKKRRAAQKAAESAAEEVPRFSNSISSNIVFDEDDRCSQQGKVKQKQKVVTEGDGTVQDMSFLIDTQKSIAQEIKRRQRMEKANEATITRLIKEDAIHQMTLEEATSASMAKIVQEEEVFHNSFSNFNDSSTTLFYQPPDPTSDAELKRNTEEDDRKKAKQLYQLCSDTEPNEAGVVDPLKWDCVRNFMLTYPELMQRASRVRDRMGVTPLHQVCRHQPPVNVIELFVSCGGLESFGTADKLERLPIHYACRHNASVEVINALVNLHPECRTKQDIEGGTPLHHAIANKEAPVGMVNGVCSEQAASTADRWGMVPLHHALTREFSKTQSIKVLMTAYPAGLAHLDLKGRAPIHWLVKCCYMDASIELLDFAFALDPALGKGDVGLHLLRLLKTCAETNIKSKNVQTCCTMILQLNPDPPDSFSKVLKTLPRWLNRGGSTKRRPPFFRRSIIAKSK